MHGKGDIIMAPPISNNTCRKCGSTLGRFVPGRVCERCLLEVGLSDSESHDGSLPANYAAVAATSTASLGRFGRYELLEEIAQGGMGVVYRARDTALNRLVALKMILAGQFASEREVKRFRTEAEAAARLDHPNIVPIYEVGEQDGRPFYSMKFMEGGTLTKRLASSPAPLDHRYSASLLVKIARAVHHAHQRAILHRDIKPGNILLDGHGEPHVSDFGLAKCLDSADGLTLSGATLGSPNYMSPEQAAGKSEQLTTASDTYSLGALLYQLITGRPPFEAATSLATMEKVLHEEPVRPRSLRPEVDRDLETICLKCLEKDPQRRYASAESLAEDVERWLRHEPIRARPSTPVERLAKWIRRNPGPAALLLISCLAILAFLVGQTIMSVRVNRANTETRATNARLSANLYELRWRQADEASRADDRSEAIAWFSRFLRDNPSDSTAAARLLSMLSSINFPVPLLPPLVNEAPVLWMSFSQAGDRLAAGCIDGKVRLWNVRSGRQEFDLLHPAEVRQCLLAGENDSRLVAITSEPKARLWNLGSRQMVATFDLGPFDAVNVLRTFTFASDRRRVAIHQHTNAVAVLDTLSGVWAAPPLRLPRAIKSFALSPDGRLLATTSSSEAQLWRVESCQPLSVPMPFTGPYLEFNFSDDSRWLACLTPGKVWLVNTATGNREREFTLEASGVAILAGVEKLIAVPAEPFRPIRLFDFRTGQDVGSPYDQPGFDARLHPILSSAALSGRIIEATWPPRLRLIDPATGRAQAEPFIHDAPISTAKFAPDGKIVATASQDRTVRLWSAEMERPFPLTLRASMPASMWEAQWSPSGDRVLSAALLEGKCELTIWGAGDGALKQQRTLDESVYFARWSSDGKRFVTGQGIFTARIWNSETCEPISPPLQHENGMTYCLFSPAGEVVATAANDHTVRLWDGTNGRSLAPPLVHPGIPLTINFTSDGRRIATAGHDGAIHVWSVPEGKLILGPLLHRGICWVAQFSPDDRWLVSASSDNTAQLWDAATGQPVHQPFRHESPVLYAGFSPDGRAIVTSTESGIARVWDTASGQVLSEPMRHPGRVWLARWSPDGKLLATTCIDGSARIWDAFSGHLIAEPFSHQPGKEVRRAEFSPDGRRLLTASFDGTAKIWDLHLLRPPMPTPDWLPELAESLVGKRIGARDAPVSVPGDSFQRVKERIAATRTEDGYYSRWAKWMLEDRLERPVKPFRP